MKNLYTITEEMINKEFGSIENLCSTIKQYGECRICLDDERDKVKRTLSKEKIKTCNTDKIMIVGTLDAIIDTADKFLMIYPRATLKDFIAFLAESRANYIKGE